MPHRTKLMFYWNCPAVYNYFQNYVIKIVGSVAKEKCQMLGEPITGNITWSEVQGRLL